MHGWFDLKDAANYCSLSIRTLRRYIGHPQHPLPVRLVGGKLLIARDELDVWLRSFPQAGEDVTQIVDDVLRDIHVGERPRWEKRNPRTRRT